MPDSSVSLRDRCLGAYLGLAIGDALGATVEFMTPREIAHAYGVHHQMVGGGWLRLQPGQVTDDTTMSLALGEALLQGRHTGRPQDVSLMAAALDRWLQSRPVDCGNTCRRGILRYRRDGSLSGPPHDGDGGNGALMRNLPVVIDTLQDEAAFEAASLGQARITHHHPLSDAAVLGFGRVMRAALLGAGRVHALAAVQALTAQTPAFAFKPYKGRASAYVRDTLQTVLHFFSLHEDFETTLIATVNQGEDADTTGALAGMLCGACCGAAALPAHWLRRLDPEVAQAIVLQTDALLQPASGRG